MHDGLLIGPVLYRPFTGNLQSRRQPAAHHKCPHPPALAFFTSLSFSFCWAWRGWCSCLILGLALMSHLLSVFWPDQCLKITFSSSLSLLAVKLPNTKELWLSAQSAFIYLLGARVESESSHTAHRDAGTDPLNPMQTTVSATAFPPPPLIQGLIKQRKMSSKADKCLSELGPS